MISRKELFELIDNEISKNKQDYKLSYEDYLKGRVEALQDLKELLN